MHSKNTPLVISPFKDVRLILSSIFFAILVSACGNSEDAEKVKEALEVNQLNITELKVTSPNIIIEFDATEQFKAEAIIDGSDSPLDISNKVKWSISNTDTATINSSGKLTGKADGLVTVTVQFADLSASKDINLSSATLTGINIIDNPSPVSVCKTGYELSAQGVYSDMTTRDISDLVAWSSDDLTQLSFDNTGIFSTYKDGISVITATRSGISGTAEITINDDIGSIVISSSASSVYIDNTLAFTATGTFDNTSTANITKMVTWSTSNASVLGVSNETITKGIATGVTEGMADISASCLTTTPVLSNTIEVDVTEEPVLSSISIEEDKNIIEFKIVDSPEQLTANLKRSDNSLSTDVSDNEYTTWSVGDTISGTPLTINSTGEITFTAVGITEVKVRYYDDDNNVGPFNDTIEVKIVTN